MKEKTKFLFLIIIFIGIPKIYFQKEKLKDSDLTEDYHPFRIKFDYEQLEQTKSEEFIEKLEYMMEESSKIFSQFINIKNNKLIVSEEPPSEICNEKIKNYNKEIKNGIKADLLIYPIFMGNRTNKRIDSEICAVDNKTKRPIIGIIFINKQLLGKTYETYETYFLQIIHHITHILGFSFNVFKKWNVLMKSKLVFYGLRNINEKSKDSWVGEKMKFPDSHYSDFQYDIMSSRKNGRTLLFSAQTLIILQRTRWYQINLSICGCSLNGNCEYLRHPIGIFIKKNLNNNYNAYCYLNENVNGRCSILKDTYIPHSKLLEVDKTKYKNYFEGNHCLNRLNIWDSSVPNIKEQKIHLVSPLKNGKCKNPQRTLYFYYPSNLNITDPEIGKYNIEPYIIKNKEMFVYHSYLKSGAADYFSFYKLMNFNQIPFFQNYYMSNFLSYLFNKEKIKEVVSSLGKYQVFNVLFDSNNLGNKLLMYSKYRNMQKLFPEDFQYVPESFILSEDREILKERFKNYIQTKNDLWIYKPPAGLQGIGIKFMKNGEDFLKYSFISKYISNPHLLYNKKYHLRMYVIVTGVLPLKIYIFDEGQVMRASGEYQSELDKIEELTSMLTNAHQNLGKPGYNPNVTFDTEIGSEWTFKTLGKFINRNGGDWNKIWNEIKDLSVKTIISNFDDMKNTYLNDFKQIRSNNIFHRYGFDILLDDKLKPWLLEVNIKPAMELYNIINERNKIKVETDRLNLMGLIPFNHFTQEPLDKEMSYKDDVDEAVQISLCEFERPHGTLELIFPVKDTLSYYKKFIFHPDKYNLALWDYIEKN